MVWDIVDRWSALPVYQPIPTWRIDKMDRMKDLHYWMVGHKGYYLMGWVLLALCAYSHFK